MITVTRPRIEDVVVIDAKTLQAVARRNGGGVWLVVGHQAPLPSHATAIVPFGHVIVHPVSTS